MKRALFLSFAVFLFSLFVLPTELPAKETPYKILFSWKRAAETGDLETYESLHSFTARYSSIEPRIPTRWFRTWRFLVERKLINHVDINSLIPFFPKEDPDTMTFSGIRLLLGKPGTHLFLDTQLELNRIEGEWKIVLEKTQPHSFTKNDPLFQKYYTESPQYEELQNHPTGKVVFLFLCNFLEEWRTEQINGEWEGFLGRYHEMSKILLEKMVIGEQEFFQFIDKQQFQGGFHTKGVGDTDILLGIDYTTLRVEIVGDSKIKVQTMLASFDITELEFSSQPEKMEGKVVKNRVSELTMIRGEPHLFIVIREIREKGLEWEIQKIKRKKENIQTTTDSKKNREKSE